MQSSNYATIRAAILAKQQITCVYQGRHREMCPHVIGYKNGREQVLSFQFAGDSSKGLRDGGEWRCMPVADMDQVTVRDGRWFTADNHSQPQTCVDEIDVEVAF